MLSICDVCVCVAQDPAFRKAVRDRWTELRAYAFADDKIAEYLEETKIRVKGGALRNYKR